MARSGTSFDAMANRAMGSDLNFIVAEEISLSSEQIRLSSTELWLCALSVSHGLCHVSDFPHAHARGPRVPVS